LLLSAFVLADSALPRGSAYRISGGYFVPRASYRAVTGSACLGRERLMEQPVSPGNISSCETETHATCRSHKDILRQIQPDCANLCHGRLPQVVHLNTSTVAHQGRWGASTQSNAATFERRSIPPASVRRISRPIAQRNTGGNCNAGGTRAHKVLVTGRPLRVFSWRLACDAPL
jgi:hypothetical protein